MALLQIEDLRTEIQLKNGIVHAVDGVSFHVDEGETLGIVGESGCGKTMTALSIMGLLPNSGRIAGGSIKLADREITGLSPEEMRKIRGDEIGMIFQDPLSSLNPTHTVGAQIAEVVLLHREVSKKDAMDRAVEVLDLVGMPRARERVDEYPHQFSGGMRQRVMIAMALANDPKLLIADEPTTALDVTIQKQILELIDGLRQRLGMAVIMVTHDLGVIAGRADRVAVMYAGKIVETTDTPALYANPRHPYTGRCSTPCRRSRPRPGSGCTRFLARRRTWSTRPPAAGSRRAAGTRPTAAGPSRRCSRGRPPRTSTAASSRSASKRRPSPVTWW